MARLTGGLDFTGKIGGLSAYKRIDMEGTFVRTPGGATKKKINKAASFERTREVNTEWKGCGRLAGGLRLAIMDLKHLEDHNITAEFSRLCKIIQAKDTESLRGQRSFFLSKQRELLEGFRITLKNPFDGVVRHPMKYGIVRDENKAWVQLPDLMPGINLYIPWQYPVFRFVISLKAIADLHHNYPQYTHNDLPEAPTVYTPWHPTEENYTGQLVELKLNKVRSLTDDWTMILAIGLEVGMPISNNVVNIGKRVGCAKILALG